MQPIHLLANSVVGVSRYINVKSRDLNLISVQRFDVDPAELHSYSSSCWPSMRLGELQHEDFNWTTVGSYSYFGYDTSNKTSRCYSLEGKSSYGEYNPICSVNIYYDETRCGKYANNSENFYNVEKELDGFRDRETIWGRLNCTNDQAHNESNTCAEKSPILGNCTFYDFRCEGTLWALCVNNVSHALVVRVSATAILAVCLTIKAIYIVTLNIKSRSRIKRQCLTFGDVLVASIIENVRLLEESMVNGGDFHRRDITHKCHKHCKPWAATSTSGEDLGHCQSCEKFNAVNHMPESPWPAISTKRKKSLISNLGQIAVSQMLILNICSSAMIAASIALAVLYTIVCDGYDTHGKQFSSPQRFAEVPGKDFWSELGAFFISNGLQLIYSALYLLLIYNITLISIENDWGQLEKKRGRLRCTIV